jgi:hypothetical protein
MCKPKFKAFDGILICTNYIPYIFPVYIFAWVSLKMPCLNLDNLLNFSLERWIYVCAHERVRKVMKCGCVHIGTDYFKQYLLIPKHAKHTQMGFGTY